VDTKTSVDEMFIFTSHTNVLQEELDIRIDALNVVENIKKDPIELTARVIMTKHLPCDTKPLTRRPCKDEVNGRPINVPALPFLYVAELDGVRKVELGLLDSVLVNFTCVVGVYLYAKFLESYLTTAHAVKE
jgi:hypothetical protein